MGRSSRRWHVNRRCLKLALWFQITGSNHISSETDTINGSATAFAYDGAGNLAQRGTTTYNYDWQNHLFAVNQNGQVTTFGYDADGKLAKRTDPDGTVTDYLGDIYELNEKTGVETKRYDQGTALVATMVNGVRSYLYAESLGSVDGANNGASFLYTPYGLLRLSSGTLPTGRQFQGQQNQSGVGLYPMGARWYDPTIGLWTQPDTLVPNPLDPLALNRYSFALGNPLTHMDPSGHTVALASTLIDIAAPLRVDQAPVQVAAPQVATRLVTTAGPVVGACCIDTAPDLSVGAAIQTAPSDLTPALVAASDKGKTTAAILAARSEAPTRSQLQLGRENEWTATGRTLYEAYGTAREQAIEYAGISPDEQATDFVSSVCPASGRVAGRQTLNGQKGWRIA